jgi:hypothetical protein
MIHSEETTGCIRAYRPSRLLQSAVQRAIRREGDYRPFRLMWAGTTLLDRLFCCWKRQTEVRRLGIITEVDFRDGASILLASHGPNLSGPGSVKRLPSGYSTLESFQRREPPVKALIEARPTAPANSN